ncbi:MAG: TonB-dependent receptor plug domain-containing protein [Flavobacteriaceae bacterium]|nr:TonB-dependent receptor plug domain-containing protein [Flavobacteriaceae bacterium]
MSKKIRHLLFCIFFLSSYYCASAQSQTREPISLVKFLEFFQNIYEITFSYADDNIAHKTIAIPEKSLSLKALIAYIETETGLTIQKISDQNFAIRNVSFDNDKMVEFLAEILVTNYLTPGISLKNDGAVNIIPQKFSILPGLTEPDVLQTIQSLPGITSVDERVSNLNVRGGTNDQNLILWNGIKMYQSGHFFGLISAFNPYLTKSVMISKNGTSAMYGDGISSIIDMTSFDNISKKISGGAGFNLINTDAYARIPLSKKLEIQTSARRSINDFILTPTYDQYFKRIFQDTDLSAQNNNVTSSDERFYFFDTSLKVLYNLTEKDKIRCNALNANNNLNYKKRSDTNNLNKILNSELTQRNLVLGIEYTRDWSNDLRTKAQIHFSNYKLYASNFNANNNQTLIQENEVIDNGFKFQMNYLLEKNLNYNGGYQYTEVGIGNLEDINTPSFKRYIKNVLRTHALYNEIRFTSNSKKTSARIGLRTNYIDKFYEFFIEPRLSFTQKFRDYFRFEILGELKSQTTSQVIDLQNDFLGIEKRRWVLSNNNNIPIINSTQASLGIHYNTNQLTISTEFYIKQIDGITTRSQGFQNQYQFIDAIGGYTIRGIDFLINQRFKNFSTWLSYTYSKNDYTFEALNFGQSFPNNVDIRHAVNFAGTYAVKHLKIALGLNFRTGKPFTKPDENMPLSGPNLINYTRPNSSIITNYFRTDISTTYQFKFTNASDAIIGFSIWNLLNSKNTINTYYTINSENIISKVEHQSLGITPNITFRVKF